MKTLTAAELHSLLALAAKAKEQEMLFETAEKAINSIIHSCMFKEIDITALRTVLDTLEAEKHKVREFSQLKKLTEKGLMMQM